MARLNRPYNVINMLHDSIKQMFTTVYGGLQLDIDTFPIVPFDEELLDCTSLQCSKLESCVENGNVVWKYCPSEAYFYGVGDFKDGSDRKSKTLFPNVYDMANPSEKMKFNELKQKFMDCTLQVGENFSDKRCYIDHYYVKIPEQLIQNQMNNNIKLVNEIIYGRKIIGFNKYSPLF